MNSANEPTMNDAFLNVRKAYRLLHDYQCMVRDAVRYIGSQLDISYNGGWSKFAGETRSGYTKLDQSSWDWLPMMGCEFHFVKRLGDAEWLSFSFFIISDTGFLEGEAEVNDKEDLSAYEKAAESSTKFAFILRKEHWNRFPFMENKVQMRNFIKEGGSLPDDLIKVGFVGKCYDISYLTSESEADKVVSDVINAAKEKAWPLERKKARPASQTPNIQM